MNRIARVAIFTGALVSASCGGDSGYCPGLCSLDRTHPTMTIEVAGGAAVLASAEVVGGPCSRLLVRSSGEAGAPTGYAAVQVTYNGPTTNPLPMCIVRVTALDGQQLDVNAEAGAASSQQACCPAGTCCPKAQAVKIHQTVTFAQVVKTISFAAIDGGAIDGGLDGGTGDSSMLEADGSDGALLDGRGEIDAEIADATGIDRSEIDGSEIDASSNGIVDSALMLDSRPGM